MFLEPDAIAECDVAAQPVFVHLGEYLGFGIANLVSTLDLPMVTVGGDLSNAWPLFAPSMFRAVEEHSVVYRLMWPERQDKIESDRTAIVPDGLGPSAGLLGAALLPHLMAVKPSPSIDPFSEMLQ